MVYMHNTVYRTRLKYVLYNVTVIDKEDNGLFELLGSRNDIPSAVWSKPSAQSLVFQAKYARAKRFLDAIGTQTSTSHEHNPSYYRRSTTSSYNQQRACNLTNN